MLPELQLCRLQAAHIYKSSTGIYLPGSQQATVPKIGGIPAGNMLSGEFGGTQHHGMLYSAAHSQGSVASLRMVTDRTCNVPAGITLSKEQVRRGSQLAQERGLGNCSFQVMNALTMDFPDNSFDLVWACESGEHMPDKGKYVEEMVRVLKPGGCMLGWGLPCS